MERPKPLDGRRKGLPTLRRLSDQDSTHFIVPVKKINEGEDVQFFLTSKAYKDIVSWILMLNVAMFPRKTADGKIETFPTGMKAQNLSNMVTQLSSLVQDLEDLIQQNPPDTGPRRFGNIAFRSWYADVEAKMDELLKKYIPQRLQKSSAGQVSPLVELRAYLLGSWGSAQRLDYGTGHELSFLAFLACLWKLGAFADTGEGIEGRAIVLYVVQPYLKLVRKLILTYTLEPAGSHGVWGLDDHSFIPYIFGSAQLSPAITGHAQIPTEGSIKGAPNPSAITKAESVELRRETNMYFDAIGFIFDVKKGPFWEHSPVLYDISGVKAGWAKINKGMIKMYLAEVLSKFPVVQHFPFGSLFLWERDPDAVEPATSTHVSSQPSSRAPSDNAVGTAAPWSTSGTTRPTPSTGANVAAKRGPPSRVMPSPKVIDPAALARNGNTVNSAAPMTAAPWAKSNDPPSGVKGTSAANINLTRAPWAT